MTDRLEETIQRTSFEGVRSWRGDCGSVAYALAEEFGGGWFFTIYLRDSEMPHNPYHVAAEIDGDLYDGTGKTSEEELRAKATDTQKHSSGTSVITEYRSWTQVKQMFCYDETVKDRVREQLRDNITRATSEENQ